VAIPAQQCRSGIPPVARPPVDAEGAGCAHPRPQGTVVLNAPRSRSLRYQALAAAFIVVLLMIAVGTAMRAW